MLSYNIRGWFYFIQLMLPAYSHILWFLSVWPSLFSYPHCLSLRFYSLNIRVPLSMIYYIKLQDSHSLVGICCSIQVICCLQSFPPSIYPKGSHNFFIFNMIIYLVLIKHQIVFYLQFYCFLYLALSLNKNSFEN